MHMNFKINLALCSKCLDMPCMKSVSKGTKSGLRFRIHRTSTRNFVPPSVNMGFRLFCFQSAVQDNFWGGARDSFFVGELINWTSTGLQPDILFFQRFTWESLCSVQDKCVQFSEGYEDWCFWASRSVGVPSCRPGPAPPSRRALPRSSLPLLGFARSVYIIRLLVFQSVRKT